MTDLPAHVRPVRDRHGKIRYRFRRTGFATGYINHEPGTPEFMRRYADLLEGRLAPKASATSPRKVEPKSLDDLARRMRSTPKWLRQAASTRATYGGILDRFLDTVGKNGKRYGDRPVAMVTPGWLNTVLARMADRPQAANMLRKTLRRLMRYAMVLEWRTDNPADLTDAYPAGKGYHTWTEAEIAQYREHHANGTMARLVFELALNTAARRCNVATIERDQIKDGRIEIAHAKGGNATSVPMTGEVRAAIEALPAAPIRHLVVTSFGKPFTVAGLGNAFREWCNNAGLPHCSMHGLRKAQSRRLAEAGATNLQGKAVTGHTKDATFEYYAAAANRSAMADAALSNLAQSGFVQPIKNAGNSDD